MRTTLNLADDVLFAAREIARRERKSLGAAVSELARSALTCSGGDLVRQAQWSTASGASDRLIRYGINPLPARGGIVCNALLNHLKDKAGI